MEDSEQIKGLFQRYLANECTSDQVRSLLAYFDLPEENQTLRDLIAEHLSAAGDDHAETDSAILEVHDKLLKKIIFRRDARVVPHARTAFPQWYRVAAIWIALVVSVGSGIYIYHKGLAPSLMGGQVSQAQSARSVVTGIGERQKVVLDDGSVIWLNAKSKLTYPADFTSDIREVSLEGEAYFEIARDTLRPFIIHSGQVQTKVLGTSFNIKAYQEDPAVAVTVLTGKVQVNADHSAFHLKPNQRVIYRKADGSLVRQDGIDALGQIAWRDGKMLFRDILLGDVIRTLQRNYKFKIDYNPALGGCPVHADFDSGIAVSKVLEMLSISLGSKLTMLGNSTYYIDGSCGQPQKQAVKAGK